MSEKDLVIITGSSGFIGSRLVHKLAGRYALAGFDKIAARTPPPQAECICIDLTSEPAVKAAFERVRIAYGRRIVSVIHLAAYYDLTGEPSPLYEEITVRGSERLLEHLQEFEPEQFVFASSMLVHAPSEPGKLITEDSALEPRWPYPQSKVDTEALIRDKRGGIPAVFLRMAGVYDDLCHSAFLSQQIARIYERQLMSQVYPGDVRRGQSYVHLDDAVEAFARVVERRKALPAELPLLIGEPAVLSYGEIQNFAGQVLHGEDWETREIPKALAKTGAWVENAVLQEEPFIKPWMVDSADDHYALDIARAGELLGWEPKHSLRDALPVMLSALKRDPEAWYRANKLDAARVAGVSAPKEVSHPMPAMKVHAKMMAAQRRQTLWAHFVTILLGAWLLTSPALFGLFDASSFGEAVMRVTAERGLSSPEWRSMALGWSDVLSGLLLAVFGALSLGRRTNWAQWGSSAVGLWLLFAPLVFWSPSAAAYLNDTVVGALAITFAILVPMMPGMSHEGMMDTRAIPPGWDYSPSTWAQRLPIIALGAFGFLIARYLAAYQMGHIDGIWEPFFPGLEAGKNGTESIITSDVSKAWPIPDAGLGAVAYLLEVLMGAMGDKTRWRTMPWMVTFFGILVVPLGVVSIYFIVIQPIQIGTWCLLCLAAAAAMLVMIPFALDELVAMGQFLRQSHRAGRPMWRMFFMGGAVEGSKEDQETDLGSFGTALKQAVRGVTLPWPLVATTLLGVWLMFTRLAFGTEAPMANSDHLVGSLIVTISIIATAEVARPLRFLNVPAGLWLIAAPWMLEGSSMTANIASAIVGLAIVALSLPRGVRSHHHYGRWDKLVV
ncbi:MAG TPA: vitamin K epoxide reductase family protein [Burkholderiales bacterium]